MPQRYKEFKITPKDGGKLIVNTSEETTGAAHYVAKQNFRRELDQEKRREGWDHFWPNKAIPPGDISKGSQHLNRGAPITLLHEGVAPSGKRFVLAAVEDKLYRYFGLQDYEYVVPPYMIYQWGEPLPTEPPGGYFEYAVSPTIAYTFNRKYVDDNNNNEPDNVGAAQYFYTIEDYNGVTPSFGPTEPDWDAYRTLYSQSGVDQVPEGAVVKIQSESSPTDYSPFGGPAPTDNRTQFWRVATSFTVGSGTILESKEVGSELVFWDNDILWRRRIFSFENQDAKAVFFKSGDSVETGVTTPPSISDITDDAKDQINFSNGVAKVLGVELFSGSWDGTGEGILYVQYQIGEPASGDVLTWNDTGKTFATVMDTQEASVLLGLSGTNFVNDVAAFDSGLVLNGYFNSGADYYDYIDFEGTFYQWLEIGSGFNSSAFSFKDPSVVGQSVPTGPQWEAVNLGDYVVLNNGIDLPVVYKETWLEVEPLYELREVGVASVGTITSYLGFLFCADLTEVNEDFFSTLMQSASPYGVVSSNFTTRRQYKKLWSDYGKPTKFASNVPCEVDGNVGAGNEVILNWQAFSFEKDMEVSFSDSQIFGTYIIDDVETVIGGNSQRFTKLLLKQDIKTDASGTSLSVKLTDVIVTATDTINGFVGFAEIQDDSSQILRMEQLRDKLIVYRDTTIFVGNFTGDATQPFIFEPVYRGSYSIYFKHSLVTVQNNFHVYLGRTGFFRFDLTKKIPQSMETFELGSDVLDKITVEEDRNWVVSGHNPITEEFWWSYPLGKEYWGVFDTDSRTYKGLGATNVTEGGVVQPGETLCWSYTEDSLSTIDYYFTALADVKEPLKGIAATATEDWFIMGAKNGVLFQYGKTSADFEIYFRRAPQRPAGVLVEEREGYNSILESGLMSLGDSYNEKDIRAYVIQFSSNYSAIRYLTQTDFVDYDLSFNSGEDTLADFLANPTPFLNNFRLGQRVFTQNQGYWRWITGDGTQASHYTQDTQIPILVQPKVELFTANAINGSQTLAESIRMENFDTANMWPLFYRDIFFKDRITIGGRYNPFGFVQRVFDVSPVLSASNLQGIQQTPSR